ncbi:LCP family protein [Nocardioides anomalus]|uniref:LCP family protein n=1 Tax=Nocardioides anomalus TaxID=2712223 RepID=A0A6G6WFS3_9ACTN|nr:LCP family protein [Nocardioides anomalus]QIG44059.1 LCP family protein [Nocardioides anomalus]
MPDRPRNDGPEDGPEYQWLYGKGQQEDPQATRPVRKQQPTAPRGDETRVMRTQPRPGARPDQRATARPTPPPVAPPVDPGPPSRGRRRFRFRARYVFLLLLLWLAYLVIVPVVAWNRVDEVSWEPKGDRPAEQPGTTYLLVGSDSRADLSEEERKELSTGDASGGRTDTIMLLHTGSGPNVLVSLPRDSIVDIPGHGETKINAAYAFGGAKLLVQTIEQATGIRVDDYVEIGMGGVAGVVDAVGGIEVCPKQDMKDKLAGLNIKKGCQEVDGTTALAYARSRHASATGDIDRVRRQREVVAAVGSQVLSPWTVINPVTYYRLNNAIPDFFSFGEGMGPVRSAMWAMAMTRVDGDKGLTCVVPLQDLAVHWDPDLAPQLFEKIADDKTDEITKKLCSPTGGIG